MTASTSSNAGVVPGAKVGYELEASFRSKVPPTSPIRPLLRVELEAPEGVMEICELRVTAAGANLPCLGPWLDIGTERTMLTPDLHPRFGSLSPGSICWVGLDDDGLLADNFTVRGTLRAIGYKSVSQTPLMRLWYGPETSDFVESRFPTDFTDAAAPSFSLDPHLEVGLAKGGEGSAEVKDGSAVGLEVLLKVAPGQSATAVVRITTQDSLFICNFSVIAVGHNLPCMDLFGERGYPNIDESRQTLTSSS